jgi:hypothetical protein
MCSPPFRTTSHTHDARATYFTCSTTIPSASKLLFSLHCEPFPYF